MSTPLLSVAIPDLPPTVNHIYRTWGGRGRTKTPATRRWQERTAATLSAIWRHTQKATYTEDVAVSLIFVTKDRRRWDIDNRLKALLDTLTMAKVIKDDSQIKRLSAERVKGEETKTCVEVTAI